MAQPRDQRKSPETATETSVVYWTGESYTKGTGVTPQDMAAVFATRHEGGYHLQGRLISGGLLSDRGLIKPYDQEDWTVM